MAGTDEDVSTTKAKMLRCVDWLQKQNELVPKKKKNQNDIKFIIECNAQRRNFLLSAPEDDTSIPAGVDEPPVEPKNVPLHHLRVNNLRMLCEWHECLCYYTDYELFQSHVSGHLSDLKVKVQNEGEKIVEYTCLWDICGHSTTDYNEMVRHINYHAYHAKLLAIGFNGRATLKLESCNKDSSKRNRLPALKTDHFCLWFECEEKFNSIQRFLNHVKAHIVHCEESVCSWAGCGASFPTKVPLTIHVRSHTGERLIACFHCGGHFATNSKLKDHLSRQNINPDLGHLCDVCGVHCATAYLLREHRRQHVCAYGCNLCDWSAPSSGSLALHVRYRHLSEDIRNHPCDLCSYKAVTQSDLRKHMITHSRKKKKKKQKDENINIDGGSSEEDSDEEAKKKTKREPRKYMCHMCPEKNEKVFSRGARLTEHLVKFHGVQWPYRCRYQPHGDGMYRLTTTRMEYLELSQAMENHSGPKDSIINRKLKFDLKEVAEATETTPKRLEVVLKASDELGELKAEERENNAVEITMCDVDEDGNIISSEVIKSDVVFT